jgi:GMC oxidoreductase
MILDLQNVRSIDKRSADVCIIGAGAAGITMAVELCRLGMEVLLLEGGGANFEDASQDIYQSEIVGLPHKGIHEGRFRVFGGTTTKWAGQILELDDLDFQYRPWVPGSGWPIAKDTLKKYYRRALEIEGLSESAPSDEDVWKAVHVEQPSLGSGVDTFFTRWCPQPNFAKLHRRFLENQPGLTIYVHANMCGFVLSESRDRFTGVLCKTMDGREIQFAAQSFVLCAGGIETARLLLQPLKDGGTPPWNRWGNVGRYFQDHIAISVARLFPAEPRRFHLWFDSVYLQGLLYVPKIKLSARLQEELGLLAVGAAFECQSVRQDAVVRLRDMLTVLRRGERPALTPSHLSTAIQASDILIRKAWRYYRHRRAYNPDDLGVRLSILCEQAPNASSRLTLSEERDALGLLKSRLDWRIGALEQKSISMFAKYVTRQLEINGIARTELCSKSLDLEELIGKASDWFHHMGTARMAASPEHGVVDEDCKLFGISNGFVCSSAVFPTSGHSNPTHTILALGVRLAEHIAHRHSADICVSSPPDFTTAGSSL